MTSQQQITSPTKTETGNAVAGEQEVSGPLIKNMTDEEADAFIKTNGRKKYAELFEAQCKEDLKKGEKSSLKIRIELNLDVEVHLTARVKGDVVIGLL